VEEIRRAHRTLARELHPDRQHGRDPAAVATTTARMQAVNEAWTVLRDPIRRTAYDRSLERPADPGRAAGSPPPGAAGGPPETPPEPLEPLGASGPLVALAGALPWLAVLGVLAAIFVFTAYAGGRDDPAGPEAPGTARVVDHRGSCVQRTGGFTLIVNCATVPNEGRIVAQGSAGASCPPGTTLWPIPQQSIVVCTEDLAAG